jgi:lipoprotein-releasing system permease protein
MSFMAQWRPSLMLGRGLLRNGHASVSLFAKLVFLSLSLGVGALIVVSSVMNGMASEIEEKLLRNLPHAELIAIAPEIPDWDGIYAHIKKNTPSLQGGYHYSENYALIGYSGRQTAVKVHAVHQNYGSTPQLAHLQFKSTNNWSIATDAQLAGELGAQVAAELELSLDKGTASPLGTIMRRRYFNLDTIVPGLSGGALPTVWISGTDGDRLYGKHSASERGLVLWFKDRAHVDDVRLKMQDLWATCCLIRTGWEQHGELFVALRLEKRVVGILLLFVLFIATLNLVSMFGLLMKHKAHSVVMLMTLGLSRGRIYSSLALMGLILGVGGVLFGTIAGILISISLEGIVSIWQALGQSYVFSAPGLYIDQLPVQIWWQDIWRIGGCALIFCIPAILIPLRTVLALSPAEVLRHA